MTLIKREVGDEDDQGPGDGPVFVDAHILRVTEKAFDDFASSAANRRMLGPS